MDFEDRIMIAIRGAIHDCIEDEIEKAKTKLERKLREQAAQITINMAKWVDVQTMNDRIVITYKQE